jgi:hypothetical protein
MGEKEHSEYEQVGMEQDNGHLYIRIIPADVCGKWHHHGKGQDKKGDPDNGRINGPDIVKLAVMNQPERC